MQHLVRNHEVNDGLLVDGGTEVLVVATREATMKCQSSSTFAGIYLNLRSDAVVVVQHTRDTVKSETVELVLLHPEPQVAEEETQNFMVTIVEQPAIP